MKATVIMLIAFFLLSLSGTSTGNHRDAKMLTAVPKPKVAAQGATTYIFPQKPRFEVRAEESSLLVEVISGCAPSTNDQAKFELVGETPEFISLEVQPCPCDSACKALVIATPRRRHAGRKYPVNIKVTECGGLTYGFTITVRVRMPLDE